MKFSRSTAKDNPNMIIREYERIIDDQTNSLKDFRKKLFILNVHFTTDLKHRLEFISSTEGNLEFNFNELEYCYLEIKKKFKLEIEKEIFIKDIREELSKFKSKYKEHNEY